MTHYPQPFAAIVRVWRYLNDRCIVCGNGTITGHYRYCSFECACYDGVASVRTTLNKLPESSILRGKTTEVRRKREGWE